MCVFDSFSRFPVSFPSKKKECTSISHRSRGRESACEERNEQSVKDGSCAREEHGELTHRARRHAQEKWIKDTWQVRPGCNRFFVSVSGRQQS